MRVIACYVVWNEQELMAESMRSLKAYVDGYVVVDSAFTSNPVNVAHSTDATRKVTEAAAAPLPLTYIESQVKMRLDAARNLSLLAVDKDWAFIVDGDETLLGARNELIELFSSIRLGDISQPVGVKVFTSALLVNSHAPDITFEEYDSLPVIYTRGVQPRLVPPGCEWRRVPNGKTFGLYRNGELVKAEADDRIALVNHRTRQSYAAYQHDYIWESAL
jgi:glycosyltransferase involved in cell wall biosynthesis